MKTKIILIICMAVSFFSCEEWLDVEPKTRIKSDRVFEDANYLKQTLMGAYLNLASKDLYGQELSFYFMDAAVSLYDLQAASEADSKYYFINRRNFIDKSTRSLIDNLWGKEYNNIANINILLENLELQTVLDERTENLVKGEALGLRAFMHFDLLRMFGAGNLKNNPSNLDRPSIPYIEVLDKNLSPQLSVSEVLDKVNEDLDNAIAFLDISDPWGTDLALNLLDRSDDLFYLNREFRFNYWAAIATKARVLLWEGKHEEALEYAEKFISETEIDFVKEADLSGSDKDFTFSREYIFGLDVFDLFEESNIKSYFGTGAGNTSITNKLMYVKGDRFTQIFELNSVGVSDFRQQYKFTTLEFDKIFTTYDENDNVGNRVAVIRKPEVYYIAAECLNELNIRRDEAVVYLNSVRRSRGLVSPLDSTLDYVALKAEIQKEYYKDLFGEGQLFYYAKRLGLTSLPYTNQSVGEASFIFPIPESELDFGRVTNL